MIAEPNLCEAMGRAAAEKTAKEGSWERYGERLLEIYKLHREVVTNQHSSEKG
jgi:hypothetical protein